MPVLFGYILKSSSMKDRINSTISYLNIAESHNTCWYAIPIGNFEFRFAMFTYTYYMSTIFQIIDFNDLS